MFCALGRGGKSCNKYGVSRREARTGTSGRRSACEAMSGVQGSRCSGKIQAGRSLEEHDMIYR